MTMNEIRLQGSDETYFRIYDDEMQVVTKKIPFTTYINRKNGTIRLECNTERMDAKVVAVLKNAMIFVQHSYGMTEHCFDCTPIAFSPKCLDFRYDRRVVVMRGDHYKRLLKGLEAANRLLPDLPSFDGLENNESMESLLNE